MKNETLVIGISGATSSGKTLLASTIMDEMGSDKVVVMSEDSYYKDFSKLPNIDLNKINYDHPDAFDHTLLCQHIGELKKGQFVNVPQYDFTTHSRLDKTNRIGGYNIIVLEGILLFAIQELRELMNIKIFMDTSLDICLLRRIRRDTLERARTLESVLDQYEMTVRPMYLKFIEPSKRYADLIVPRGGANRIAIDMIKAKIKELLDNV